MSAQTIHLIMNKLAKQSMELSMRWAKRCKIAHKSKSALFGIVQGGMYKDLREVSLNKLIDLDFNGIALWRLKCW